MVDNKYLELPSQKTVAFNEKDRMPLFGVRNCDYFFPRYRKVSQNLVRTIGRKKGDLSYPCDSQKSLVLKKLASSENSRECNSPPHRNRVDLIPLQFKNIKLESPRDIVLFLVTILGYIETGRIRY